MMKESEKRDKYIDLAKDHHHHHHHAKNKQTNNGK